MRILSYLPAILSVILVNILFSFIDSKLDLTEDKKHSISEETINILNNLDDQIFIKVYLKGDFPAEFKHLEYEVLNLLRAFRVIAGENLDFEFINPNKTNDNQERLDLFKQLVKNGLTPTDIEVQSVNLKSNQIIFPGALVYYKEKKRAINFLQNSINKDVGNNINNSVENLEYELI